MAVDSPVALVGLATDVNPHAAGRRGALRIASDVVIDRPSMARCRPGFDLSAEKTGTAYEPVSLKRYASTTWVVTKSGSTFRVETPAATLTGAATPPSYDRSAPRWLEARENLYLGVSTGLKKIESAAATALGDAGMDVAFVNAIDFTASGTGPIAANDTWAYRLIGVKKDTHDYVRRSVPSVRMLGFDTGGGAVDSQRIYFSGLAAGDKVEGYRTRTVNGLGAIPSTDHYLAWTYVITSTDVTNKYFVSPVDVLANDDLGAAAYTNPSREGIANGKVAPPIAAQLALFEGCAWYGDTISKHRLIASILDVGGSLSTYRTDTGLQCRRFAGDFTLDSPNITNVASITGLVVGMALTDTTHSGGPTQDGTYIKANTKIQSISGAGPYTVVMDTNASATGAAQNADACDVVLVNGVEFYAFRDGVVYAVDYGVGVAPRCFIVSTAADYSTRVGATAAFFWRAVTYESITGSLGVRCRVIGDADYNNGQAGQVAFEEVGLGGSAFTLSCPTRPLAWSPQLGTAESSSNDTRPGRLWWSDPQEPEAVPLLNYVDIGSQVDPILALTPLAGAMLVWKRDGLFRVSGTAPDGWRVDQLNASLRLIRPECVDVMGGVAYAWTNEGVVSVSASGDVRSISAGLIDAELEVRARQVLDAEGSGDVTHGCYLACIRSRRLVLVGVPAAQGDDVAGSAYCWSAATEAWSTWGIKARCAAYDAPTEKLYLGHGSQTWEVRVLAGPVEDGRGYDRRFSPSGWTATAGSTTIVLTTAQAGQWVPKRGDWIAVEIGGTTVHYLRVLSAVLATDWTLVVDTAFPSGSVTKRDAYEGIVSTLEWQAQGFGGASPTFGGLWRELHLHLAGVPTVIANIKTQIGIGARGDLAASATRVTATTPRPTVLSRPIRAAVSRQVARAQHFYPSVEINEFSWPWLVTGLGYVLEGTSERVRR